MVVAHRGHIATSPSPVLARPGFTRAIAGGRRLLMAAVVLGAVGVLLLAPEHIVLAGSSLVQLALAMAVALLLVLHVDRRVLERDLRRARVRSVDARDLERQRIQRDLHDSAQQRLVSVRIHLGLLAESMGPATDRTTIEHLGTDLDEALKEIGAVTQDGYPQLLLGNGVAASLRAAVAGAPLPVTIESIDFGRYPDALERHLYFCCMEALQNVFKHAGRDAVARVRLFGSRSRIAFEVDDTGVGFDPARVKRGDGLDNLADRLASLGGRLIIDSRPGMGTRIRGEAPIG